MRGRDGGKGLVIFFSSGCFEHVYCCETQKEKGNLDMKALAWDPGGGVYGLGLAAGWPQDVVQVAFPFHAGFSNQLNAKRCRFIRADAADQALCLAQI